MLKFYNFDIVCQEIPDEITLAINLTNCPNMCEGCHSPWLRKDIGDELDVNKIVQLVGKYGSGVTCICFMGGDAEPGEVNRLAKYIHSEYPQLKTAWYSGRSEINEDIEITSFDYIKLGGYVASLGGLRSETTNQRLYKIENGEMTVMKFQSKNFAGSDVK